MKLTEQELRDKFEEYVIEKLPWQNLNRLTNGDYVNEHVYTLYELWKACYAMMQDTVKDDWQSINTAPKDGTMLCLMIATENREHSLEDTDGLSKTIGFNSFKETGEDRWEFVGWCWDQWAFTNGIGTPVLWKPFYEGFMPPEDAILRR